MKSENTKEATRVGYHHFFTLHLKPDADIDEIRDAYRQSVKKFHPDLPGGNALIFHRVQAAYDALCNTSEREEFLRMHSCRPSVRATGFRSRRSFSLRPLFFLTPVIATFLGACRTHLFRVWRTKTPLPKMRRAFDLPPP